MASDMKFTGTGMLSGMLSVMLSRDETFRSPAPRLIYMSGNTRAVPETGRLSGLRRLISDSFIPMVVYSTEGDPCTVTVGPAFPGEVCDLDIGESKWIVQKDSVLGAGDGVEITKHSEEHVDDPRLGTDGLVLAELSGTGTAFISTVGNAFTLELRPEQHYTASVAHTAGWQDTVRAKVYDADGWEGVTLVDFKGPGKVILQSLSPRRTTLLGSGPDTDRRLL